MDRRPRTLRARVAARLRAVGGVATTLSGGLDSSLVAATAARQLAGRRRAHRLHLRPRAGMAARRGGWDADDGPSRPVAAMHPNMTHELVRPDGRCALDIVGDIHRAR